MAFGQTAPNPVLSTIRYFKDEYIEHIEEKKCRGGKCKALAKFEIDPEKCKKCGLCAKNCPTDAIEGELGKVIYTIIQEKCIKCGTCVGKCPFHAIHN